MADDTTPTTTLQLPSLTARNNYVLFTLLFFFSIIVFTTGWGDDSNTLHTSAQSWAFAMSGAVIGAHLFAASWDSVMVKKAA